MRPPYRTDLPIYQFRGRIVDAIRTRRAVILTGATGCGKSTQLPLLCLEAGRGRRGRIGITQPRRIAAVSLAEFTARQFGQCPGDMIGYATRFHRRLSASTRVKYMTDGVLLAELRTDRLLRQYDTIIIDEAHERSLNIDILIGCLRRLLEQRRDLCVVISSATIDAELFSRAFGGAPVIDVPGKLFPVELLYAPFNLEDPARSFIDEAVVAAVNICDMGDRGDILVFMPAERDILEAVSQLDGRALRGVEILPLYSRLTHAQQTRIFRAGGPRRIIVATNIAETSLTVPGIRFVVDTGLARVKRYSPSQRITRLPIEPVPRASADQRKGRCGRMAEGMCIRLYSEEDYRSREEFGQPEIQRCNLSDAILKMAACGLGPVEEFPFLEAPSPKAIREGYAHLRELNAIDAGTGITPLGRRMAGLPIDPHIAAMLLAARGAGALREAAVVAAGLSIVDPRERPAARRDDADLRHRRFADPSSDFLTLLRLWNQYHGEWDSLKTQNRMRKFCAGHFLSFNRMREWSDVHEQICRALAGQGQVRWNTRPASSPAIHRAILCGLISSIARRTEQGTYRTTRGREAAIFPGSSLAKKQPAWIMCNEYVETSRLFARTVAEIDPLWIEEVAPHLCRRQYGDAFFDEEQGCVRACERVTVFGLPVVERRLVMYSRISPEHAREIFIRDGLVDARLRTHHRFLAHNAALMEEIRVMENKLRRRDLAADEESLFRFYDARLPHDTASVHDLNRCIRERAGDAFLRMSRGGLPVADAALEAADYPGALIIGGREFPLVYTFDPSSDRDGVTVMLHENDAPYFSALQRGWTVRPLWQEKIAALLGTLPKELRRACMPLEETAALIAAKLAPSHRTFEEETARLAQELRGVAVQSGDFRTGSLPAHLTLHISTVAPPAESSRRPAAKPPPALGEIFDAWGRRGVTAWDFGELSERIPLSDGMLPLFGYPALRARDGGVDLALCADRAAADLTHEAGVRGLAAIALEQDLDWMERQVKFPHSLRLLCAAAGGEGVWRELLLRLIRNHALDPGATPVRDEAAFLRLIDRARGFLATAAHRQMALVEEILAGHARIRRIFDRRAPALSCGLREELAAEIARLPALIRGPWTDPGMLRNAPRYYAALELRIERAGAHAAYREKAAALARYRAKISPCQSIFPGLPPDQRRAVREAVMMIEEYAISLFAQQDVKTLYPVSEKRLDAKMALLPPPLKA